MELSKAETMTKQIDDLTIDYTVSLEYLPNYNMGRGYYLVAKTVIHDNNSYAKIGWQPELFLVLPVTRKTKKNTSKAEKLADLPALKTFAFYYTYSWDVYESAYVDNARMVLELDIVDKRRLLVSFENYLRNRFDIFDSINNHLGVYVNSYLSTIMEMIDINHNFKSFKETSRIYKADEDAAAEKLNLPSHYLVYDDMTTVREAAFSDIADYLDDLLVFFPPVENVKKHA